MRLVRPVHVASVLLLHCLAGSLVLFTSGCGDTGSTPTTAPPVAAQQQDAEKAAREKAGMMNPAKPAAK